MVAETFLSNPDNLPQVNHKDCDKANNHVDNLEWISCSNNGKHAWENGKHKDSELMIKVNKINDNGEILETYRSIAEACRKNNISNTNYKLDKSKYFSRII